MNDLGGFDDMPAFHLAPGSTAMSSGWKLFDERRKAVKQEALAAQINMDKGQLSDVLNFKQNVKIPQLVSILDALGLKLVDKGAQVIDERDFEAVTRAAGLLYTQAPHLLLKG